MVARAEETKDSNTMLHSDDNDAARHEAVRIPRCIAICESSSMDEYYNGVQSTVFLVRGWRVDVKEETIFCTLDSWGITGNLYTHWSECCCIHNSALWNRQSFSWFL